MLMFVAGRSFNVKNMAKQFLAKGLQQEFLRFKMRIEGRSADVGGIDDLANGDLMEVFFGKQHRKCAEDRVSGFSLSSVHANTYTSFKICSVLNIPGKVYIAFLEVCIIILPNNVFGNELIVSRI